MQVLSGHQRIAHMRASSSSPDSDILWQRYKHWQAARPWPSASHPTSTYKPPMQPDPTEAKLGNWARLASWGSRDKSPPSKPVRLARLNELPAPGASSPEGGGGPPPSSGLLSGSAGSGGSRWAAFKLPKGAGPGPAPL